MSAPTAGAPRNAAVIASTKLNMNAMRIRTCETPIRISSSSTPSARASVTRRSTPNATSSTDTIVSPARTHTIRRRDELEDGEAGDDDHGSIGPVRGDQLEEPRLERAPTGLDGMDAAAGGDDRGDQRRGCARRRAAGRSATPRRPAPGRRRPARRARPARGRSPGSGRRRRRGPRRACRRRRSGRGSR